MNNNTRPTARWTTVRENGRDRLVMTWSLLTQPAQSAPAQPVAQPHAVPSAA